jgi:5-dehydro-2-deoxygluconokinase
MSGAHGSGEACEVELRFDPQRRVAAVIVGRAGMDLYPVPDGIETETAAHFAAEIGGSAGNIAVAIARQGLPVALCGAVSDDAVGRFVRRHLERFGVDISQVRNAPGSCRTSLAICETRPADSETVFYRSDAADLQLRPEDIDAKLIGESAFLVVTGTSLATEPSRAAALRALKLARAAGTCTILDIDHRPVSWVSAEEARRVLSEAARDCTVIVGNEEEFAVMGAQGANVLQSAEALVRAGHPLVIFKRGEAGSVAITADGTLETASVRVEAKKPFGAGDAFLGSLVVAVYRGMALGPALHRASAAAAYVVCRRGCAFAMPTAAELDQFISSHSSR